MNTANITPRYLTEKEVSDITGFALSTLRNARFLSRGIPYLMIGRSVRYRYEDVIDFMERHFVDTIDE